MLFHEKLSLLKEALGTTSSALARSSGLDASCICRYLGAKTQPPRYGKAVASIAAGAAKLAVDDKRVRELRKKIGAYKEEILQEALVRWLNAADSSLKERKHPEPRKPLRGMKKKLIADTAQRLDLLMETFKTSNAALARYVNVDASAISRYRAGKRSLSSHAEILPEFCRYFAFLSRSQRLPEPLAAELRFLQEDEESAAAKFLEWFRKDDASHLALTRGFLDGIAEAAEIPQAERRTPRGRAVEGKGLSVAEEMFLGGGSVERAFARFAESALDSEKGRTIYF